MKKDKAMANNREARLEAFGKLLDVLDELRVKCPWDAKQTNESLRPNTVEEVMELSDALMRDDVKDICKELGDVLLHIIFYAKIADEQSRFDISVVCDALRGKLSFRHPHVFGTEQVSNAEQVIQNWEQIKLKEKGGNKTVLAGVPESLPALIKCYRIPEKAANVGFDWEKRDDVWDKVKEELAEVEAEMRKGDTENEEKEFGDLMFSIVNAARLYGVHPDTALEKTNRKFIARFNYVESEAKKAGKALKEMTLGEMDALWNEAKRQGL